MSVERRIRIIKVVMFTYLGIAYGYAIVMYVLWSWGYRYNLGIAFLVGLLLVAAPGILIKFVAPIAGSVVGIRELRRLRQDKSLTGSLGETKDVQRPSDEEKVRAALSKLGAFANGCPSWLTPAVDQWLTSPPGDRKTLLRDSLLLRLYDEAGKPGDILQRHALNDVRLAINPWVDQQ